MTSPQEGILVIADITGYTAFLSGSELEHAEDSLRSLLGLLIQETKPPLAISRLEGDAVISYAPIGSFHQGQSLVELIESTYVEFRNARQKMVLNTTCTCNACRNIPNLDLKFFVHAGTFVTQPLANYTELVGSDVNLIHRLTKNSVKEKTGFRAYALYTERAIAALDIHELAAEMVPHTERYEHLGEVLGFVQDLNAVWDLERGKYHVRIKRENSLFFVEGDLPVAPALAWDYLTKPEYRAILFGSDGESIGSRPGGRTGSGAVYYCAHGSQVYIQTIVDWVPFEYYTYQETRFVPSGCQVLITVSLQPTEVGTQAAVFCGRMTGPLLLRTLPNLILSRVGRRLMARGLEALAGKVEADLAANPALSTRSPVLGFEHIEAAIVESRRL